MPESADQTPKLENLLDSVEAIRPDIKEIVVGLIGVGYVSEEVICAMTAEEICGILGRNTPEELAARLAGMRSKIAEKVQTTQEKMIAPEQAEELLGTLKSRFETNRALHGNVDWEAVEKALRANPEKLWSLAQLESTGGEPDVISEEESEFIFGDCSTESPLGRRNVVFDEENRVFDGEKYLKKNNPDEVVNGNAADMVAKYGADLMDEEQYHALQKKLSIDGNSWSWLKTPPDFRNIGQALVGNRSKTDVFVLSYPVRQHAVHGAFRAVVRVPKA